MAAAFPTIRSGAVACYGSSRSTSYQTTVVTCQDQSDFRFPMRGPLGDFALVFSGIDGYDLGKIRAHWQSAKGGFDATWDLVISGNTYHNCAYADDNWNFTESATKANYYSGTLTITQTSP